MPAVYELLPSRGYFQGSGGYVTDFRDNNETVMLAPASGFYKTEGKGKNEVRIAYVLNAGVLKRCITILEKALQIYNKE